MSDASILVLVSDDENASQVVDFAARLASREKSNLVIIYVIEVDLVLPVTADLDSEVQRAEDLLRRLKSDSGYSNNLIETQLLQGREKGTALVDEAVAQDAEAIVVSVDYDRRLGAFEISEDNRYILEHAGCAVWLIRQPLGKNLEV
jgi:nucleotide-binding universal stress UspA family protein